MLVQLHIVGHTQANMSPELNGFQGVCEASKVKPPFLSGSGVVSTHRVMLPAGFYKECVSLALDLAGLRVSFL